MSRKHASEATRPPFVPGRTAAAYVNDIPGVITDPPVDTPASVAGLEIKLSAAKLEAERERMEKEAIAERLSRFGDKAGKHGAMATCLRRVPIMLRIPDEHDQGFAKIARSLGTGKTTVMAQLICAASHIPAERWYEALAALPRR